jgi:hypothetical protein
MLDAETFLARIVPADGYIAFAYKGPNFRAMAHRFFPYQDLTDAANWMRYVSHKIDVWYAVASYKDAAQAKTDGNGNPIYKGKRDQANTVSLKCFWYDADISRPGDNKSPDQVYTDDLHVTRWLAQAKTQGLPIPNLWIRSGYGVHLYWVLDTPLPRVEWITHAQRFRQLLINTGARGDIGVSTDCARILRIPESWNHKVPANPTQCYDMTPPAIEQRLPDYKTQDFIKLLPVSTGTKQLTGSPAAPVNRSPLLSAAKAGLARAPHDFKLIANRCPQVARSLAEAGATDARPLWHLMLNLAYLCGDKQSAHDIGSAHPTYSVADTDNKWDQTEAEHQHKDFGAPFCASFDSARPGICSMCHHWQKITSPYSLGLLDDPTTTGLPSGYRHGQDALEIYLKDGWTKLVEGAVSNPKLFRHGDTYRLLFDYTFAGRASHVVINDKDISSTVDKLRGLLVTQGVSLNYTTTIPFGKFIMAWIEELRKHTVVELRPPFGWVTNTDGTYLGLSVAGTFYGADGSENEALTGDPKIHEFYQPRGNIDTWKKSVEFVVGTRPDLQATFAVAFAAPIMELVGESGILSIWSKESATYKTSVFHSGSSVWCDPIRGTSAIRDTTNSVQQSLMQTRFMPVFWDEVHIDTPEQRATMVEMFFNITQGRGRARLDQKMEQRDPGQWRTMMATASNHPMSDLIEQDRQGTDAGTLRVFEYRFAVPSGPTTGPNIAGEAQYHYGHAGRVYAKWLAQNVDRIKTNIKQVREIIKEKLEARRLEGPKGNERFYIASIVGIVVGAAIAKHLGLVNLQPSGILNFLLDRFIEQRAEREENNPVHDEAMWLSRNFEKFVSDHTEHLLVTQSFIPRGRPRAGLPQDRVRVLKQPGPKCVYAKIHIGLDDAEMRFDRQDFIKWCFANGLSYKGLLEVMQRDWSVSDKVRNILAKSTDWASGGQVYYHRVPLTRPELSHHLGWGTPVSTGTNVVPLTGGT